MQGKRLVNKHQTFEDAIKSCEFGILRADWTARYRYVKKFRFNSSNLIYHYTDLDGLIGILGNRGFWLSEAIFLNDSEELYNGLKITKKLIQKLISKKRYSQFVHILKNVNDKLDSHCFNNYYICSFSLKKDDLEQWRAYAKNGTGFCIGFDIHKKTSYPHFQEISNGWPYAHVIYDDQIKTYILLTIIFKYCNEYKKDRINGLGYSDDEEYIQGLFHALISFFVNFKNDAFSSEKEVRIIYASRHHTDIFNKKYYRNCNNVLVPYVCTNDTKSKTNDGAKLEVDMLPVSEIIVGPAINQRQTIDSVQYFIQDLGYPPEIVKASSIPFRG